MTPVPGADPTRLLVVCLGNICRSPLAEGALCARIAASPLAGKVEVDSAGTGGWHAGAPPDRRAVACARRHGVDIAGLRARQLRAADFADFHWLLCADAGNLRDVRRLAPATARDRVALLTYDALSDQRLAGGDSIRIHQIRAAMCTPLWSGEKIIGVFQVDTPFHAGTFNEKDLDLLTALVTARASAEPWPMNA